MLDTKLEFESHCVSNFGRVKIEMRSNKIFTASFTSHNIRKYIDGSSKVYAPVGSDSEGVIISHDQSHVSNKRTMTYRSRFVLNNLCNIMSTEILQIELTFVSQYES